MQQKKQENLSVKDYSLASNIAYLLKSVWKWKKSTLFFMGVRIFAMGAESYVPLLVTKFVIDGIESGRTIREFLVVVVFVALFQMVMSLIKSFGRYQIWHRMAYVSTQYQLQRVQKIHTIDYEQLESQQMQDLVKRAEDGADATESFLNGVTTFGFHLFKVFIACAIIFTASPWMILIVVLFSICRYQLSDRTKKWVKQHIDNENISPRRQEKYYDSVTRDFKYGKDIRLFQMADVLYDRLKKVQLDIYTRTNRGRRRKMLADDANMALELFIQTGIMYAWMVYDVLYKGMTIGNFTLYLGSIRRFGGAVSNIFSDLVSLRDYNRRMNDFRTFMECPDTMQEGETVALVEAENYTFVFDHVWFRYPGHEEYVLKDISLTIEGGKRLAVVGPNGAGKSTFIKLLCRLYKPAKGKITVNGVDIWKLDQQSYFHLLAPVFQNVESYATSLAQNISLQSLKKTDKKMAEASIRKAGLSNKIDTLDKGIDTQLLRFLYEDGIDLSGGEKQKLSFARALYKVAPKDVPEEQAFPKAKVFVLDEPTAALDPLAEYRMYTGFNELIGENTAVYISHRLSSTRFCHQVALFEGGQLLEYGTHEELLKKSGRYAELYQIQARYYQEEKEAEHE